MANVSAWDKTVPSGASLLRDGDDQIRSDKSILQATLLEEHYFTDSAASGGIHKRGSARVHVGAASSVSTVLDDGRLMWTTDFEQLYVLSSVSTVALPSTRTTNSWTTNQRFAHHASFTTSDRFLRGVDSTGALVNLIGVTSGDNTQVRHVGDLRFQTNGGTDEVKIDGTNSILNASVYGVATKVKNGAPATTDWTGSTPPAGTMVYDSGNNRLYVYSAGAWYYAQFTLAS